MSICVYGYIYVHKYVYIYTYMFVYLFVHTYIHIYGQCTYRADTYMCTYILNANVEYMSVNLEYIQSQRFTQLERVPL